MFEGELFVDLGLKGTIAPSYLAIAVIPLVDFQAERILQECPGLMISAGMLIAQAMQMTCDCQTDRAVGCFRYFDTFDTYSEYSYSMNLNEV